MKRQLRRTADVRNPRQIAGSHLRYNTLNLAGIPTFLGIDPDDYNNETQTLDPAYPYVQRVTVDPAFPKVLLILFSENIQGLTEITSAQTGNADNFSPFAGNDDDGWNIQYYSAFNQPNLRMIELTFDDDIGIETISQPSIRWMWFRTTGDPIYAALRGSTDPDTDRPCQACCQTING